MATVYLARDLKHHRLVALKVLHPELAATLGPERFLREIEVTAGLDHPHILPMLESGEAGGLLWYTMPYVEGESLRDRLRREIQLPVDDAVRIAREIADGLEYAHRHRVVHRDIKPENILLAHGHARVADFGVAQALESAGGDRLTGTGLAIGTPLYMSPEQSGGGGELDGRSDLYSLGCVLYEMLAGEPPFTGRTPQAIIAKRLSDAVPAVRRLRPTVPPSVDSALIRALARVPGDRFATIGEFAAALQSTEPSGKARRLRVPAALAVYTLGALAVLGMARLLTSRLGLPDWVVSGALVLLLVGLPIILATAVLQGRDARNAPASDRARQLGSPHWLTWRRALWGGGLAFAGLGVATTGYMALRSLGIGPMGTLLAAGVLHERERLILADFGTRQVDSSLSGVLTEALRIDLAQSPAVTLVPSAQVAEVLGRMQRSAKAPLDPALAREVAIREGIKGVLTGEIAKAGTQYLVSAQLLSAGSGEVLTAHRVTAPDSTALIAGIDRLSKQLRAKIGESLQSIGRAPPLERVTTSSLPALRQYTRAIHAGDHEYDPQKAIALLRDAIAIDSGFAMAYRTLGVYQLNAGEMGLALEAFSAAIERRERLTERERYVTLGDYHNLLFEPSQAIAAYQAVLENYPNDPIPLNNLAGVYLDLGRHREAESLLKRAIATDSLAPALHGNLIDTQLELGKWTEARASYQRLRRLLPDIAAVEMKGVDLAARTGDYLTAVARTEGVKSQLGADPTWRANSDAVLAELAATRGRFTDAESYWRDAMAGRVETAAPVSYLSHAIALAGVLIVAAGQPGRGLREVEQALARYPMESLRTLDRPYLGLAALYALGARPAQARAMVAEYERVVEPRFRGRAGPDLDMIRGRLAAAEGRWPEVISWLQRAVRRRLTPAFGLPDLGRAYDMAGEADSAIAVFERYLATPDLDRAVPDATYLALIYRRLGKLHEERGQRDKAREYYSRFIELWKDCDPEFRPEVTEVRRRLVELAGE